MDRYRVTRPRSFRIASIDPGEDRLFRGNRGDALAVVDQLGDRLDALQERLYAEGRQRLLIVLQAMDTGGKDGTIKRVFDSVDPLGVRVASFKAPNQLELTHDYLWRVHAACPAEGEIVIFNRSHYEDVLVVRVNNLVPAAQWKRRYAQIRDFERMLGEEGTTIVKFYLHISKQEQKERLQARLDDPTKHWKFNPGDLAVRSQWNRYMAAYQEAIRETSTPSAPWYVVPANKKWYRDYVVASVLVQTLERMNPKFPKPTFDPKRIRVR
jgi:PPK2 family polyphosphate:nucleotide phosphotransferase